MAQTPDTIVEQIITELCTVDFKGINAKDFWGFVDSFCKDLDNFTKSVVWFWLLEKQEFEVWNKSELDPPEALPSLHCEDKTVLPEYQTFFEDESIGEYIIKVSEDCQSVYLTGVQQKDNILGGMPYELLRIIAKHKEKGINSLDLIKESGQDKRSLTTRLQVLENNLLITKFSVSINKCVTNHMIHFRFAVKDEKVEEVVVPEYYDRYEIMIQVMEALKKEETKLRLTKDLFEEVKESQPILKLKWFNKILSFLVENKFIEMVQVEYNQRFFSAIRYLNDLPSARDRNQFLEIMRDQTSNGSQLTDNNFVGFDEEGEEPIDQPNLNRYFSLPHQIFSIIQQNPGVINAKIDTELTGRFNVRTVSNVVESITSNTPHPDEPDMIFGQMVQAGKTKYYRFTTQNVLNRRDPNYKYVTPAAETPPPVNSRSLFEESIAYGTAFPVERRLRLVSFIDKNQNEAYYAIPKGYKGKLGNKAVEDTTIRYSLKGSYHTQNEWISYGTNSRKAIKNTDAYKTIIENEGRKVKEFNEAIDKASAKLEKANSNSSLINQNEPNENSDKVPTDDVESSVLDGTVTTENLVDKTKLSMDYGPEYRRKKLLELTEENNCVCVNTDLCAKMSKWMKVGYTVDRRTLIRDATTLEAQKLVVTEKLDNGKFIIKSINNPPTDKQIKDSIMGPIKHATRKFASQVQIQNLSVRNEKYLIGGSRFANQESRLQHAKENTKPQRSRKRVAIVRTDEQENNEEQQQEVDPVASKEDHKVIAQEEEEEDLLEPLMDDRKRKKFKVNNRPQAKVAKAFKKIRTSVKVTNEHVLKLIKAIIVTQSLSVGGNIDWPTVSKVLEDNYTVDSLRRQWPKHRKMLGQRNLLQAKKNWEATLLSAVSNGLITSAELDNYNIFKMLDIWKGQGADIFINKAETEILADYDANFKHQVFKPLKEESGPEVFRECASMIEKEQLWSSKNFMYSVSQNEHVQILKECETPTELQLAKTKLKALFATNSNKFNSNKVKELFSNIPKEAYSKALTELENEKAIAFLGEDSKIKFTLTDRLMLTLDCKLDDEFVDSGKRICEIFNELDTTHKAILLSTRSASGCYAPLFSLMSDNDIVVTRVDQKMTSLNNYYTKSLDRSKLEADFLISHYKKGSITVPKKVPIPLGAPCSYLWVDLEGDFNEALWHKCVYVLVWSIVFHPGTPFETLVSRLDPLLEPFEVKRILDWAVMNGNVVTGKYGGYWPTKYWYYVK